MEQPTIQALWQQFRDNVVPKQASQVQIQDTESAFYAGAAAMMGLLGEITEGAANEDEACEFMSGVDRELKKHVVQVMARAMAQAISQATGADVHAEVNEMTRPPGNKVH